MLSLPELKRLGKRVVEAMQIGRKWNECGIEQAKKFFPRAKGFFNKFAGKKLSEKQLLARVESKKIIEKLLKPDYGPLLRKRGSKYLVWPWIGESVRLRYHYENWPLAKEIILAAALKGAHISYTPGYSELDKQLVQASAIEALEDFTPLAQAMLRNVDVTIYLENEDDPEWKAGLPLAKLKAGQSSAQRAHEIVDKRRVRWLYLGWPFAKTARRLGVCEKWFKNMVFSSLKQSFSAGTKKLVGYYYSALRNSDRIRITHADGSDLSFSIKGRPILRDAACIAPERGDWGLNLPSGEVFVAPLETSAEGKIRFEKILAIGHGFVEGLELKFEKGRVVDYSAKKNEKHFTNYLKENTPSTRVLAELGIGCNSSTKYCGYILTDEKIAGTIHLAIGNNTGSYHGRNKASGHLDMVKDMRGGVLWVDGNAVMKNGKPALAKN